MLIFNKLSLTFGDQIIFDDLDGNIQYDEKIGLLGRNGTGKSTLLRAIAGNQYLDSGSISFDKKKKIGYLPQEVVLQSSKSVFDEAFSIFDEFLVLQREQKELEQKLEEGLHNPKATELSDRYVYILEHIAAFDHITARQQTENILKGLGFTEQTMHQVVETLSVGWQMRIVLAKLLLQNADFYLFDEPTNHLDLQTKEWFLQFLKDASFGYLLVTHDRHFLEQGCTKIIELERGKAKRYHGNFSFYCKQKEEDQMRLQAAKALQDKEIARKQATIDRFRYKSSKRGMVQSMEKQLEKMEIIEVDPPLPTVNFSFGPVQRSGKIVLEVKNLSHAFGQKKLFDNVSLQVMRGQKVALIAPNGTGKTTLFNLIVGNIPLQQGNVSNGHNVESAYFEQEQARILKPNNSVLQEVLEACPKVPESKIRSFLGSFLFSGDDVEKKIHQLSGGERNRVAMVKILLQDANLLLLDEPTNHLDLYAKQVLLQALQQYQGTMLLVSHDHDFIQQVADTIVELTAGGLFMYQGNYESYLYQKKMHQKEYSAIEHSTLHDQKKEEKSKLHSKALKKQIHSIEREIATLEKKRDKIALQLAECSYDSNDYIQYSKNLTEIQEKLNNFLETWESMIDQLD